MKNILYMSYDGMTDPLGQSQVLPYIIGLGKLGYSFTLISFEKPERFDSGKKVIEEICKNNNIEWHPLPYTKKPPILSTIKDVRKLHKVAFALHKEKHFSIVHCRGYITTLVGLQMKKQLGVPFLFDMRGLWANEKVDAKSWDLKNPIFKIVYNFFKKKEKEFFNDAAHTISLTEAGKEQILSWKDLKNNPIQVTVIPCCADTNHFDRENIKTGEQESLRKELGIDKGDFVLSYLGSIGTWYMLEEMLDFYEVLIKRKPAAKFLFITGDEHEMIRANWRKRGLATEDLIIKKAERKNVPLMISLSNFSIFFIRPTYSKIWSSPTKQGELMAMGVPVICNGNVGDTGIIVQRYHSGIEVKEFSKASYLQAIKEMNAGTFDKNDLRKGACSFFDLSIGIKSYERVYKLITG